MCLDGGKGGGDKKVKRTTHPYYLRCTTTTRARPAVTELYTHASEFVADIKQTKSITVYNI